MKKIILASVLFVLFSCTQKVPLSQVIFNNDITTAYYEGEKFSGEVWSEDNRTMKIKCDEGKITLIQVFHVDGNVALESTSISGTGSYYDTDGNKISADDFRRIYPDLVFRISTIVHNMYCSEELK